MRILDNKSENNSLFDKFEVKVENLLPINGSNMLQDYDLRDIGNKIYKNEIMDEVWIKQLNSVNSDYI